MIMKTKLQTKMDHVCIVYIYMFTNRYIHQEKKMFLKNPENV